MYRLGSTEFIRYARISLRTLRSRVKSGELKPTKEQGKLLFNFSQLPDDKAREAFLRDRGLLPEAKAEPGMPGDLKPWQKATMLKRVAVVEGFLAAEGDIPPGRKGGFQKHFAKMHGMSPQTLRRHLHNYKEGGREALAPLWNPGSLERVITKEMWEFIEDEFLKPLGPPLKEVYEKLSDTFKDHRLPTYRTVAADMNKKRTKAQQLLIRDKEMYDRKYAPYVNRDYSGLALNDLWFVDSKQLDIFIRHHGRVVRPWVTVFIDAASRKFVGWVVTLTPDADAIARAFVMAVQTHGLPKEIYCDRGKAFKSHKISGQKIKEKIATSLKGPEFDRILGIWGEMGIKVRWAAPWNAREKGIIEAAFQLFTYRLRGPGYCGHNIKVRPKKLAAEIKSGKLPTLGELSVKVDELILSRNARMHPSTKKIPNSCYETFIPVIPSKNLLAFLLMDVHHKKVRSSAVTIRETSYRHEDMWRLNGEEVEVRRDPKDLRQAAIIYKGEFFCVAPEIQIGDYASPLTKENMKMARKIKRSESQFRKKHVEQGGYIENPLKLAVHLSEKEREIEVTPRAPKTRVVSLHKKERLAKKVAEGLKEAPSRAESGARDNVAKISKNDRREQILGAFFGD